MDWHQTQVLLDNIATSIVNDFRSFVSVNGAYPDNLKDYPEKQAEEDAHYYLSMKQFPLDHPDIDLTDEEIEQTYGLDSRPADDIRWRRNGGQLSSIESIRSFANDIIKMNSLNVSDNDQELFCQKVAEVLWKMNRERKQIIDENIFSPIDRHVNQPTTLLNETSQIAEDATISIGQKHSLVDIFNNHFNDKHHDQKELDGNQAIDYKRKFHITYEIFKHVTNTAPNNDLLLEDIKMSHITHAKQILRKFPKYYPTKFGDYAVADICKMIESENLNKFPPKIVKLLNNTIGVKTMLNYTTPMRGTINFAIEEGITETPIFSKFVFKVSKKLKKDSEGIPFTPDELERIFNTEIHANKSFDKPFKYWLPIILLYSGARLNEICNLRIEDIITIGKHKYFNVNKSKTDAGIRQVPIHSMIIKLKFFDFINYKSSNGSNYIFDDLKEYTTKTGRVVERGNKVSQWFNIKNENETRKGHLNLCGITKKGKKLHSFRNTFINHLKQNSAQLEVVKELVGHEGDDMTWDVYAEGYAPEILKQTLEMVNYRGYKLPWLTNKHYLNIPFPWEK